MPDPQAQSDPAADADAQRAQQLFQSSQTYLMRRLDPRVMWLRIIAVAGLLLLFFIGIPLLAKRGIVPDDGVNFLGKFLCFGIVALGIDLIWGYTGLLSLCQALFFALGGYLMGMHLSLPEGGGRYDYPQFMTFAYYGHGTQLPWFWQPFRSGIFTVFAALAVPGLIGGLFGFFILRKRVRGVYFSIVTQALAAAAWLLISRNEMLLGGSNGLTNFYPPLTAERNWKIGLYLLTLGILVLAYLFCRVLVKSRLGRVLVAIRDKETRLYFAGYKPYAFKVFAFCVGAMLAALGGMLYAPQLGIINPQQMDVQASIFMVVMVALGGRGRLWGALYGGLFFMSVQKTLTTDVPLAWNLVVGLGAIATVLFLPDGLSGLWTSMERQITEGKNFFVAITTVLPLIVISIFLLADDLGIVPPLLQALLRSVHAADDDTHVLIVKYSVLALSLGGAIALQLGVRAAMEPPTPPPLPAASTAGVMNAPITAAAKGGA
jgi:urea transport system permease protein